MTLQEALDVLALMKFPYNTHNLFNSLQQTQAGSMPVENALQVCPLHFTSNIWDVYMHQNNQEIMFVLKDKSPSRLI